MPLTLSYDLLYTPEGLKNLDQDFLETLDSSLRETIRAAREHKRLFSSEELLSIAPVVERFLFSLFRLPPTPSQKQLRSLRRNFVERLCLPLFPETSVDAETVKANFHHIFPSVNPSDPYAIAALIEALWDGSPSLKTFELQVLGAYTAWATRAQVHPENSLFWSHGVPLNPVPALLSSHPLDRRDFSLTDQFPSVGSLKAEQDVCLVCHTRQKDTCRTGYPKTTGPGSKGCPLDQKISEMFSLIQEGQDLAALAVVCLDNPLVALTGRRICTGCKQGCIFQTRTPIDVPSHETALLQRVLKREWGVEVYSLLTRWNPLNTCTPYRKSSTGKRALVVGQGPAGLMAAHLLLQKGHDVVGVDGILVQPVVDPGLIKQWNPQNLHERKVKGFGGVAEYGITSRWDKNFLDLIHLFFQRSERYTMLDGVNWGGALTSEKAKEVGFQIQVLALGAGPPRSVPTWGFPTGVRMAADVLMTLNLGQPWRLESPTALDLQLPIVVIGGGLTAIDVATEVLAYYPHFVLQVKKAFEACPDSFPDDILPKVHLYLEHAERYEASDNWALTTRELGGVKVIYRGEYEASPAYQIAPEEIGYGIKEGIEYLESEIPQGFIVNEAGEVRGVPLDSGSILRAGTVLLALGTEPRLVGSPSSLPSFEIGDMDPEYHGSVVGAMASAKVRMPKILEVMEEDIPFHSVSLKEFTASFRPMVEAIEIDHEGHLLLTLHAPAAARTWKKGQFFRLQIYDPETEPIPVFPIHIREDFIQIKIILSGASTHRLTQLKPGDRVVLMGPVGSVSDKGAGLAVSMQCMLGGLCGRCLQETEAGLVFGCRSNSESSPNQKKTRLGQDCIAEKVKMVFQKQVKM